MAPYGVSGPSGAASAVTDAQGTTRSSHSLVRAPDHDAPHEGAGEVGLRSEELTLGLPGTRVRVRGANSHHPGTDGLLEGGGQKLERLFYSRLLEVTKQRGLRL